MTEQYSTRTTYLSFGRVHWPSIVAGAFVALSLFVVSVVLARACSVDVTFQNAHSGGYEAGAVLWGAIAALICFGVGGLIAGRAASAMGYGSSWFNGLMVWAVAVPLLVYFLGAGVGPRLGQTEELGGGKSVTANAMPAGALLPGNTVNVTNNDQQTEVTTGEANAGQHRRHYISHAQAASWWMLVSLGLGFVGATVCGSFGGRPMEGTTTTRSSSGSTIP